MSATLAQTPTEKPREFVEHKRFLDCVHCGLCLSACPTYLETGKEMDSPRGRIHLLKSLQDGRLPLSSTVVRHIDLCLGCRACEAACPSGVQYGNLLEHGRDFIERNHRRAPLQSLMRRLFIEGILPFPNRMKFALLPAHLLQVLRLDSLFARLPWFRSLFFLPNLSKLRFEPLPLLTPAQGERRMRVGMVAGCVASVLCNETNQATIRLLTRAGCEVVVPPTQSCCGALHLHGGSIDKAKELARHNIDAFEPFAVDAIIINAAGCGSTLKEYGHLLKADPGYTVRAGEFAAKVKDLSEFLTERSSLLDTRCPNNEQRITRNELRVTYHDACHLAHAQGIKSAPRQLLQSLAGVEYVELNESDVCCGSAGSYNLTEPAMATQLQRRKALNLKQTGADVVVTTNPGCIFQIQAGLKQAGLRMRVMHLAEFLDDRMRA